jgi:hypothetical protein
LALKLGIQAYQILTDDDEVCIPSLSSIFLAVLVRQKKISRSEFFMILPTIISSEKYIAKADE